MKKLKAAFLKGFFIFIVSAIIIAMLTGAILDYLKSEVFQGELPYEYGLAFFLLDCFLFLLIAISTMIKPARAINIEKERRINKWHVTGVHPDEQGDE